MRGAVISAKRFSIRILDAHPVPSTGADGEDEVKLICESDAYAAEANRDRACTCEMAWSPENAIKSMLVLAPMLRGENGAAAEPAQKRMMIATRNCRTVATTFMIKVNSTR